MNPKIPLCLLALLGTATYARIDLGNLATSAVKTSAPWGTYRNRIDSASVETRIEDGVAVSLVRFTWTPSVRIASDPCNRSYRVDTTGAPACSPELKLLEAQDSLESRLFMTLPKGSVVTGMWLWVGATKVEGAIQQAGLAQAQYNSIVGVRRDPALLSSWGGDTYNLQVFPLKSDESRTVELRVVQPIRDGGFEFPVSFRPGNATGAGADTLALGRLRAGWTGRYDLDLSGSFKRLLGGRKELVLTQVGSLEESRFTGGKGSVWSGRVGGRGFVGGALRATREDLDLATAPAARLLVLDGGSTSDSLMRCRKLALLQIRQLMDGRVPVQLLLRGSDGRLAKVFPDYVVPGSAELTQAYRALAEWTPGPAGGFDVFREIKPYARKGRVAVVLGSALKDDVFGETAPDYDGTDGLWAAWKTRAAAFDSSIARRADSLARVLAHQGMELFVMSDNYALQDLARRTGGGLLSAASWTPNWLVPQGDTGWTSVELYGPSRVAGNAGVVIDSVTSKGLDSLYRVDRSVGSYANVSPSPWLCCWGTCGTARIDTLALDWAAQGKPGRDGHVTVHGRWGGLGFSRKLDYSIEGNAQDSQAGALWARARLDGRSDRSEPQLDWKVGSAYHMVTSGSSLLALEPGMRLWDSADAPKFPVLIRPLVQVVIARDVDMVQRSVNYVAVDTLTFRPQSTGFDQATLESILAGRATGIVTNRDAGTSGLAVSGTRDLRFGIGSAASVGELRIQDLQGRLVTSVPMVRDGSGWSAGWHAQGGRRTLVARVKADGKVLSRSFQVGD